MDKILKQQMTLIRMFTNYKITLRPFMAWKYLMVEQEWAAAGLGRRSSSGLWAMGGQSLGLLVGIFWVAWLIWRRNVAWVLFFHFFQYIYMYMTIYTWFYSKNNWYSMNTLNTKWARPCYIVVYPYLCTVDTTTTIQPLVLKYQKKIHCQRDLRYTF